MKDKTIVFTNISEKSWEEMRDSYSNRGEVIYDVKLHSLNTRTLHMSGTARVRKMNICDRIHSLWLKLKGTV